MAYSNVTPPTLPAYDSETNSFYLLVFNYEPGAEDWYMVHLIYGAWRFQYEDGLGVTNIGTTFTRTYANGEWSDETQDTETLALNPGLRGNVYQRIYTNANIFNGDEIWLAENSVTPVDGEKFPLMSWLTGLIASICSGIRISSRTPVAYLYNGVRLPALPEWDREAYPFAVIFQPGSTTRLCVGKSLDYQTTTSGAYQFGLTGCKICVLEKSDAGEAWGEFWDYNMATFWNNIDRSYAVWTNADILNADGTVAIAASVPVPVYE